MSVDADDGRADRVVLIGLGNRLRGDDAIGPIVGERVLERLRRLGVPDSQGCIELHCGPLDAMAIVEAWSGAAHAIVLDAAGSGDRPGTLHRIDLSVGSAHARALLPGALARSSSHGLGLAEAIGLGHALGRLPPSLVCFAIEAQAFGHAEGLSPEVGGAVEAAVARIADEIVATWHHRHPPPPAARGD